MEIRRFGNLVMKETSRVKCSNHFICTFTNCQINPVAILSYWFTEWFGELTEWFGGFTERFGELTEWFGELTERFGELNKLFERLIFMH